MVLAVRNALKRAGKIAQDVDSPAPSRVQSEADVLTRYELVELFAPELRTLKPLSTAA